MQIFNTDSNKLEDTFLNMILSTTFGSVTYCVLAFSYWKVSCKSYCICFCGHMFLRYVVQSTPHSLGYIVQSEDFGREETGKILDT